MRLVGTQGATEVVGRPFGSLIFHVGDTTLAYRVSTSRMAQDASALADDETLLPSVAQRAGSATLEHGLHQEIRLRHTAEHGATLQVTAFHDRTVNPLVQGSGSISDADAASGDLLIDPVSGVFRTAANTYGGYGFSAGARVPLDFCDCDFGGCRGGVRARRSIHRVGSCVWQEFTSRADAWPA